jgi:putative Holliday junction resolvase
MPESLPKTLLGFDFGLKQIGVAYGQTLTNSASGLTTIKASDGVPNWTVIQSVLTEWQPNLVLVGLPLNMDGTESELSTRARKFARRLQGRFAIEVLMVDERLTSREARSIIREAQQQSGRSEPSRNKRKGQDLAQIDYLAATLILISWLESPELGESP